MGRERAVPFPGARRGRLATRVADLNCRDGSLRFDKFDNVAHVVALIAVPKSEAVFGNAPLRGGVRGFSAHDAAATRSTRGEMSEMPIVHEAIVRRILAHGRKHNPVPGADGAEGNRPKEMRDVFAGIARGGSETCHESIFSYAKQAGFNNELHTGDIVGRAMARFGPMVRPVIDRVDDPPKSRSNDQDLNRMACIQG